MNMRASILLPKWMATGPQLRLTSREWWALGISSLVLFAVSQLTWQQHAQLQTAQHTLRALQVKPKTSAHPIALTADPMAQQQQAIHEYLQQFPEENAFQALLIAMNQEANQRALVADQANFRYSRQSTNTHDLAQYDIEAPVQGPYPQIKRYIQTLQHQFPTLALEELALQRGKINEPQVQAEIHWVFYFHTQPSAKKP